MAYLAPEEMKIESEQEAEIDGVDPWKAAMQVKVARFGPVSAWISQQCVVDILNTRLYQPWVRFATVMLAFRLRIQV